MTFYRPLPVVPAHRDLTRPNDDLVLSLVLGLIGGVRVAVAVATCEVFTAEATVALLMMALAFGVFIGNHHRQTRH